MKHCEPTTSTGGNLGPRLFKETTTYTVSLFLNNKKKVFLFFGTLSLTLLIFIQRYVFAYNGFCTQLF